MILHSFFLEFHPKGTCLYPNHYSEKGHSVDLVLLLGAILSQVCMVSSFAGLQDTEELP